MAYSSPEKPSTPFFGAPAVRQGLLTRRQLRTGFQQVLPGVYLPRGIELDAVHRAHAAWVWARGRASLAGRSAAAVLGVDGIPPDAPAAIVTPSHLRAPPGIEVYRTTLATDEQTDWLSIRLTTPARTAYDVVRRLHPTESLPLVEQLYVRTGLIPEEVWDIALRYPGSRGSRRLRRALGDARIGVPTLFQSRTRGHISDGSLPRPETMIHVCDEDGCHPCHAHIGWRRERVAVQCLEEGSQRELENLNTLVRHGWLTFVVSALAPQTQCSQPFPMLNLKIKSALRARAVPRP